MGTKPKGKRIAGTSKKPPAIEYIFRKRWNRASKILSNAVVTFDDLDKAMRAVGVKLSRRNLANFFKDFIRKGASANRNWPTSIFAAGYTGEQLTGKGNSFQFVPIEPGQTEPFPRGTFSYPRSPGTPRHSIQSVSLSPFWRLLGRKDETWLIQVLVRLNVVETHFALFSKTGLHHVGHLQTGVRQTRVEIDALFLGEGKADGNDTKRALITLEGKGAKDDILEEQIVRQVEAVFRMKSIQGKFDFVVPLAAKVLGKSEIYLLEYESIPADTKPPYQLRESVEVVYRISPPVEGIA